MERDDLLIYELPDLHYAPAWIEEFISAISAVSAAAETRRPDLIALAGDLFDRALYATDKSEYGRFLAAIRELLAIAPVVAIEGTPSHDAPGCYDPLEALGLVVLRPGLTYGLDADLRSVYLVDGPCSPDAIIFGFPELRVDYAGKGSAKERVGRTLAGFERVIDEAIAPARAGFPGVPAIGVLHGVVSDSARENETDEIKKRSSLLIHTEILERARLDRWVLGDIHTPWESERISAGYAGFAGHDVNPWGKTGFVPAFNATTIRTAENAKRADEATANGLFGACCPEDVTVERIPYGAPRREKIAQPLPYYDPGVAYWLVSDVNDPSRHPALHGAHPKSRITFQPKAEKTRRVTSEEADSAATIGARLELMLPDETTERRKELADSIDASRSGSSDGLRAVRLSRVEVRGARFFGGDRVVLDVDALPDGLSAIDGDNGEGKSSILGFASPYPVVIGKDTESGRASAIKEFFEGEDASVEKVVFVGDVEHRHRITIKAAGKKSAKTECFLEIDGVNVLATTTFDEMLARCESEYGSLEDHLRTYQHVQPQQGGSPSGLMSAGPTDLRNVTQSIAGIDRSVERRAALDRVDALKSETARLSIQAQAIQDTEPKSPEELAGDLSRESVALADWLADVETIQSMRSEATAKAEKARAAIADADAANAAAEAYDQELAAARSAVTETAERIDRLSAIDAERSRAALAEDDENRRRIEAAKAERVEVLRRNSEKQRREASERLAYSELVRKEEEREREHQTAVRAYDETVVATKAKAEGERTRAASLRDIAAAVGKPCEFCGKLSSEDAKKRDEHEAEAVKADAVAAGLLENLSTLKAPDPFAPGELPPTPAPADLELVPDLPAIVLLPTDTRELYESEVAEAERAKTIVPELRAVLADREAALLKVESSPVARVSTASLRAELLDAEESVSCHDGDLKRSEGHVAEARRAVAILEDRIRRAKENAEKLADLLEKRAEAETDLADWTWIAAQLAANKLPAFELELSLEAIDRRATENIRPFREGRYRIRTVTQTEGNDGKVDRFAILIFDAEEGVERSFLKYSPGEKAFFSLAYGRALVAAREERIGVVYSPSILDEADGPVQAARIPEFYAMQQETAGRGKTIVVSHSPEAKNHITNIVTMKELKG
jgi:exonuclease SbcC